MWRTRLLIFPLSFSYNTCTHKGSCSHQREDHFSVQFHGFWAFTPSSTSSLLYAISQHCSAAYKLYNRRLGFFLWTLLSSPMNLFWLESTDRMQEMVLKTGVLEWHMGRWMLGRSIPTWRKRSMIPLFLSNLSYRAGLYLKLCSRIIRVKSFGYDASKACVCQSQIVLVGFLASNRQERQTHSTVLFLYVKLSASRKRP